MAYFANGSEGMYFEDQCVECLQGKADDIFCPIAYVQMEFNYSQEDNDNLRRAITALVDEKGNCRMKPLINKYLPGHRQEVL